MLAYLFALGRFLGACSSFCGVSLPRLADFGASWRAPGEVPGGSGEGFKASGPYFPAFLHACALAWSKCSECDKTTVVVVREPQQYAGVPYPKRVLDDGY